MFHTSNGARTNAVAPLTALLTAFVLIAGIPLMTAGRTVGPEPETVSLYLNVDKNGGLVTGLGRDNFRLYLDGKYHPFRLEEPEKPASIALLMEYSRSSGYYLDDMNATMSGFLKYAPEGNWYAFATYSQGLTVNKDFTQLPAEIGRAYSELGPPFWNEINTYDAIYEMLDKLGRLPGRRILIICGSGIDTFSEHTLDHVKKKLEAVNVVVFVAGAGSPFRGIYDQYLGSVARMNLLQSRAFLQMVADNSGGFAWFPNQFNAFPDVIQGTMQSVESQYRLVYESPVRTSGKFQKIKVEAFRIVNDKREDFKVLVRSGWR